MNLEKIKKEILNKKIEINKVDKIIDFLVDESKKQKSIKKELEKSIIVLEHELELKTNSSELLKTSEEWSKIYKSKGYFKDILVYNVWYEHNTSNFKDKWFQRKISSKQFLGFLKYSKIEK
jgi:hypothetical protein